MAPDETILRSQAGGAASGAVNTGGASGALTIPTGDGKPYDLLGTALTLHAEHVAANKAADITLLAFVRQQTRDNCASVLIRTAKTFDSEMTGLVFDEDDTASAMIGNIRFRAQPHFGAAEVLLPCPRCDTSDQIAVPIYPQERNSHDLATEAQLLRYNVRLLGTTIENAREDARICDDCRNDDQRQRERERHDKDAAEKRRLADIAGRIIPGGLTPARAEQTTLTLTDLERKVVTLTSAVVTYFDHQIHQSLVQHRRDWHDTQE